MRFAPLLLLWLATPAVAAPLTHEPKAPYLWRVVMTVAPHPTLGPAVRARLAADLKAALGPALGDDLGRVEVIDLADVPKDKWEPLWKKVAENGWSALDADGLKDFQTLTDVKTHFLTVKAADGNYTLESRQHCGSTGMASPRPRTKTLPDLDTLARTAGLMLAADFGPVGTAEPLPDATDTCILRLRGGELPGADRWLAVGDVYQFAVVSDIPRTPSPDAKPAPPKPGQKVEVPTDRKSFPQKFTLLKVVSVLEPGVAKCEVFTPFPTPFVRGRQVSGYRALKIGTRDAAVSVRLADGAGKPPPPSAPLQVWATGFSPKAQPTATDLLDRRDDLFVGGKPVRGVATVTIKLGTGVVVKYPVPVLDHGGPVPLTFEFDEAAVAKARFENAADRFYNRVVDARMAQGELFKAVGELIGKDEVKAALKRAEDGVTGYAALDAELTKELGELRQHRQAKEPIPAVLFANADRILADLRGDKPKLEERIANIKEAIAKADNPAEYEKKFRANEITRQIAHHVQRGEVPEALEQYDRLIEFTNLEEAKTRKAKLEAEWKPKGEEHAAARAYLTGEWAKLEGREAFDAAIPELRARVEVLAKNDDRLGLRLALTAVEGGAARLGELTAGLSGEFSEEKETIAAVRKTVDALLKVEELARAELKRIEPAPPEEKKDEKKPDEEKKPM